LKYKLAGMAFKLFKKHCPVCGKEVAKGEGSEVFGKRLCSQEHAEKYRSKIESEASRHHSHRGGGCCQGN
jgi:endogenous inhibitor of DNA gyrase (YacG/DUF329 family)